MHLTLESLKRILSVPKTTETSETNSISTDDAQSLSTKEIVKYQIQDLWKFPFDSTTSQLTTIQSASLLDNGAFYRLEEIVFAEQGVLEIQKYLASGEIKTLVANYPNGEYELNARCGLFPRTINTQYPYGAPNVPFNFQSYSGQLQKGFSQPEIGKTSGFIPYLYKPLKVSRNAFIRLSEWKHGFSIERSIEYANNNISQSLNLHDVDIQDQLNTTTALPSDFVFNNVSTESLYSLDESYGIDQKAYTFSPNFYTSEISDKILGTYSDPYTKEWQYLPQEKNQYPSYVNVTEQVKTLFPMASENVSPLESAQIEMLQKLAINHCSQFDWSHQYRDFDTVALRQSKLLDFNCIPIAPLELNKDFAVPSEKKDVGISCYGDLPILGYCEDPASDGFLYALCRIRQPINVPLPQFSWSDVGLSDEFGTAILSYPTHTTLPLADFSVGKQAYLFDVPHKIPFSGGVLTKFIETTGADENGDQTQVPVCRQLNVCRLWDWESDSEENFPEFKKMIGQADWNTFANDYLRPVISLQPNVGFCKSEQEFAAAFMDQYGANELQTDLSNSIPFGFTKQQCVNFAPKYIWLQGRFPYDFEEGKIIEVDEEQFWEDYRFKLAFWYLGLSKTKKETQQNEFEPEYEYIIKYTVVAGPDKKQEIETKLEMFKDWANSFFLNKESYLQVGSYKWIDDQDVVMFENPIFAHPEFFNKFDINIKLRSPPDDSNGGSSGANDSSEQNAGFNSST